MFLFVCDLVLRFICLQGERGEQGEVGPAGARGGPVSHLQFSVAAPSHTHARPVPSRPVPAAFVDRVTRKVRLKQVKRNMIHVSLRVIDVIYPSSPGGEVNLT